MITNRQRLKMMTGGANAGPASPAPGQAAQAPLSRKAMLVSLQISQWNNRKIDEAVTDEVAANHNSDRDFGRYSKILLPKAALEGTGAIVARARQHYLTNTLPWTDWRFRILPSKNYLPFVQEQSALALQFGQEADKLVKLLPQAIQEAQTRLNTLFNPDDYPSPEALRARFSMEIKFLPFPDAEDFRVQHMTPEEVEHIRDEISRTVRENLAGAQRDLWTRLHETVTQMRDRLAAYTQTADGKIEHPFRDSVVSNLRSLVELLPRLNFDDDPSLESMRISLDASLCALDANDLRASEPARDAAIKDADELLAKMAGFVG